MELIGAVVLVVGVLAGAAEAPSGLQPGDVITGGVDGISEFEVTVGPRA